MTGYLSRLSRRCEDDRRAAPVGDILSQSVYRSAAPANKCTRPGEQVRRATDPPPSRVQRRQKVAGERDICGNFGINGRRLLFLRGERSAVERIPRSLFPQPHVILRTRSRVSGYLRICLYIAPHTHKYIFASVINLCTYRLLLKFTA